MRLVHTYSQPSKYLSAKIYFNRDLSEYNVKFYKEGKHLKAADYFTEDKSDAVATAKDTVNSN